MTQASLGCLVTTDWGLLSLSLVSSCGRMGILHGLQCGTHGGLGLEGDVLTARRSLVLPASPVLSSPVLGQVSHNASL